MNAKKTAPMERYTTIAGEVLEYPRPEGELARFFARVVDAAHDPRVSEGQMVELIYGSENPMLDQTIFEGRGAVTREVFDDPLYHVMLDLLDQKRVAMGTLDPERAAGRYTMTAAEAAEELDMTPGAVRQAIAAKRLDAWKKGGRYLLDPHSVATYRDHVVRRGPKPRPALEARIGNVPGASMKLKANGKEEVGRAGKRVVDVVVPRFERAAVAFSGEGHNRTLIIESADEDGEIEYGPFWVRGRFRVVEEESRPRAAATLYKAIEPA